MLSLLNLMHHKYSVERRLCWAFTYILNRLWIVHMVRWPLFTPQISGSLCCLFLGPKPDPTAWMRLLNRTKMLQKNASNFCQFWKCQINILSPFCRAEGRDIYPSRNKSGILWLKGILWDKVFFPVLPRTPKYNHQGTGFLKFKR